MARTKKDDTFFREISEKRIDKTYANRQIRKEKKNFLKKIKSLEDLESLDIELLFE